MTDVFTKAKRSQIMSRIMSKDTSLERGVFRALRRRGVYFQRHYAGAPGKPDIALPSKKRAVFIHGDFWHGYRFSKWERRIPKDYWREKIASNMARDRKHKRDLQRSGWRALTVWEHEIQRDLEKASGRIALFLRTGRKK